MKLPYSFFIFLLCFAALDTAHAQPAAEVYLFDLQKKAGSLQLKNLKAVSKNPGRYDNQPSFSPDGSTLYFVSADSSGQTDIYQYQLKSGLKTNFSNTYNASEYSPTPTPDGKFISCIRVVGEEQLLWKFPLQGGEPEVVVPSLVIGYHAWWNDQIIVSFVLGEPQTLQINRLVSGTNEIVAENIGRSIHRIPGSELMSFLQNREAQAALIQSLDVRNGKVRTIAEALKDSFDMAWTPTGDILMASEGKLFVRSEKKPDWTLVSDLSAQFSLKGISRLAVSPDGKKIALVAAE